jgi:hypothetical protein
MATAQRRRILVWHLGGAITVAMIAGAFGSRVLDWRARVARECGVELRFYRSGATQ